MTLVKICGITRVEDALAAAYAGADFIGIVFARRSPRCLTPDDARTLVSNVRGALKQSSDRRALAGRCAPQTVREPRFVGVFVDESAATINGIVRHVRLDVAQLHGAESPETVASIEVPVIRALGVDGSMPDISRWSAAKWIMYDSSKAGAFGGTGRTFDWSLLGGGEAGREFFLAGGLTPDNVAEAVRTVKPFAVDVSSGVESSPGIKDAVKIRAFVDAVRGAGRR